MGHDFFKQKNNDYSTSNILADEKTKLNYAASYSLLTYVACCVD